MLMLRNDLSAGCEMEVQDVIATIEKRLHMHCCLSDPLEIVYTAWSVTEALNETERAIGKNENISPKHSCATFSPMETTTAACTRTTP